MGGGGGGGLSPVLKGHRCCVSESGMGWTLKLKLVETDAGWPKVFCFGRSFKIANISTDHAVYRTPPCSVQNSSMQRTKLLHAVYKTPYAKYVDPYVFRHYSSSERFTGAQIRPLH